MAKTHSNLYFLEQQRKKIGQRKQYQPEREQVAFTPSHSSKAGLDPRLVMFLIFGMTMLPDVMAQSTLRETRKSRSDRLNNSKTTDTSSIINVNSMQVPVGHNFTLPDHQLPTSSIETGTSQVFLKNPNGGLNMAVGSPGATAEYPSGRVTLDWNIPTTGGATAQSLGQNGTIFYSSNTTDENLGINLSKGDFDGNGKDDLLIQGGPGGNQDAGTGLGPVYIVLNPEAETLPSETDLNNPPPGVDVVKILQTAPNNEMVPFGIANSIGDPDGSGYDKIGVPSCANPNSFGSYHNYLCIVNGRPIEDWRSTPVYDLNNLQAPGEGTVFYPKVVGMQTRVGPIPNLTGTNMDGFYVTAPEVSVEDIRIPNGITNLVYPNPNGFPAIIEDPRAYVEQGGGKLLYGGQYDYAGWAVTSEVTLQDGSPVIVIGAPSDRDTGPGRAYLVKLPIQESIATTAFDLTQLKPTQGLILQGCEQGDKTGRTVAPGYNFFKQGKANAVVVSTHNRDIIYIVKIVKPESNNTITLCPGNPNVVTLETTATTTSYHIEGLGTSLGSGIAAGMAVIGIGAPEKNGGAVYTVNGLDASPPSPSPSPSPNPPPSPSPSPNPLQQGWSAGTTAAVVAAGFFAVAAGSIYGAHKLAQKLREDQINESSRLVNG